MHISIIDNVLEDPDAYVAEVLSGIFIDVPDGDNVFKGIQLRENDLISIYIKNMFPDYAINYNFIRKSPKNQEEPNFIHNDSIMGDLTVLLYLNKKHPKNSGTTFYEQKEAEDNYIKISEVRMKYNRMVVFPSEVMHSRNIKSNFGTGNDSRLIQVLFLNKKQ